jgi:uncharacterized membrane protein YdjX (TVP38/TMEM64 family)
MLSMVGTMGASVVGFSFASFIAKDWVLAHIPERLSKYNAALERNAFLTVFLLRLVLWMPQALHSFFGASNVGFWTHFWASALGYLPPLFVVSYLGAEMFDVSGRMQPEAWPILCGLLIASLLVVVFIKLLEQCRRSNQALGRAKQSV